MSRLRLNGTPDPRRIYKDAYGQPPPQWHIHHIDYDKTNNDPSNLIALPPRYHDELHVLYSMPTLNREQLQAHIDTVMPRYRVLMADLNAAKRAVVAIERELDEAFLIDPSRLKETKPTKRERRQQRFEHKQRVLKAEKELAKRPLPAFKPRMVLRKSDNEIKELPKYNKFDSLDEMYKQLFSDPL